MRAASVLCSLALCVAAALAGSREAVAQADAVGRGEVRVHGLRLWRDGRPWIAHGFYQIAFEVAPANLDRADHPFWKVAYEHYGPVEYQRMRQAGADSVRLQISQQAADPRSAIFDKAYLAKALDAVRAARGAGLTVILCVQDESHVPGDKPIDLPDEGTQRVWRQVAPAFAHDNGVMFELLNEPRPKPNPPNWARWKAAMTTLLRMVRALRATNVIIADGLDVGQVIDGAPLLDDPQVAYASHPYALQHFGETRPAWEAKFGRFSRRAPVIITEWLPGSYHCDPDTPASTVRFIQYLQEHGIGLEIGIWDWAPKGFGSVRQGFPEARFSSYAGLDCHQPFFGSGHVVETWYKTGVPAAVAE